MERGTFQGILIVLVSFLSAVHSSDAAASFNEMTCVDVADPGSNGQPYFVVSLSRKSINPADSNYKVFQVKVERNVSDGSSIVYETIGVYTAVSGIGQGKYYSQFKTISDRTFELNLYRTSPLPFADLIMITNTVSRPSERVSMQLECSTGS